MGVVTLVVSLIMFKLINHTAGPEYTIGKARLGGFNGMPDVPVLNMPFDPATILDPVQIFYLAFGLLLAIYLGLKLLQRTKFGRVTVAIRENETRAQLLGYDVRLHKVIVFAIGGAIAGMGGGLYATYQAFIDPNAFALVMSAQCLIWVMVGGLGTLVGPIIACCFLQYLTVYLGSVDLADNSFILGVILIAIVLLLPRGILPSAADYAIAAWQRLRRRAPSAEDLRLQVDRRAEAS
jgi:branched-chain amino acid transport system permease protein